MQVKKTKLIQLDLRDINWTIEYYFINICANTIYSLFLRIVRIEHSPILL